MMRAIWFATAAVLLPAGALAQTDMGWAQAFSPSATGGGTIASGTASWSTAWRSKADFFQTATGSTTPRNLADRASDVVNVRDYGARGDGGTDDTAAFNAAIAVATSSSAPRASNSGVKIYVPCGKYILTAKLTVTTGPNAAIGFYGDTASCTELQWNVAGGGLDFELPQQTQTSQSRSLAVSAGGLGVGIDVEHLSLVNNAPGNVFTGTALRIAQPIPTASIASNGPDQTIEDVRWYSLAPGQGGVSGGGQAWMIGIETQDVPNVHIDHATGVQWGAGVPYGPSGSVGIHVVSTGGATDYTVQQYWITNYSQQGAYRGVGIDGHSVQGVYASGLFLLQNAIAFDWEAPSADASASFTLTNSSLDGMLASIHTTYVRQEMISNTEMLSPGDYGTLINQDWYGIIAAYTDNVMITNNVIIGTCMTCAGATPILTAGHHGYDIVVTNQNSGDNQTSEISGNSLSYGDYGVEAFSSQILVSNNAIAAAIPNPVVDGSPGAAGHPVLANNNWGSYTITGSLPVDQGIVFFNGVASGQTTNIPPTSDGAVFGCSGTLASFTFDLPTSPINAQTVTLGAECTITAFTLVGEPTTAGITVLGAPAGLSPSTPLKLIYDAANKVWLPWR